MTFLTCTAFLVGTRIAVSRAPTHGGAIETACTWVKNLGRPGQSGPRARWKETRGGGGRGGRATLREFRAARARGTGQYTKQKTHPELHGKGSVPFEGGGRPQTICMYKRVLLPAHSTWGEKKRKKNKHAPMKPEKKPHKQYRTIAFVLRPKQQAPTPALYANNNYYAPTTRRGGESKSVRRRGAARAPTYLCPM